MRKILFICSLLILWGFPASAEWLSDGTPGGYRLWLVRTCGSAVALSGGGYTLQDMKGQGYAGDKMAGGLYVLGPGGIWVLTGATPEGGVTTADTGRIRNTTIVRADTDGDGTVDDVQITWAFDDRGSCHVDIWRCDDNYSTNPAPGVDWKFITVIPSGDPRIYNHTNSLRDGKNYFYRVVPSPLLFGTTLLDDTNNSRTVAKIDVWVGPGWNMIACPLEQNSYALADTIGDQLTPRVEPGDELYNPQMLKASYSSSIWANPSGINLALGEGYYVYMWTGRTERYISFAGVMPKVVRTLTINPGYNLIGNSSIIDKSLDTSLPPGTGTANAFQGSVSSGPDEIYKNDYPTQGQLKMTCSPMPTGWVGPSRFDFIKGEGFWYFRRTEPGIYNWQLDPNP